MEPTLNLPGRLHVERDAETVYDALAFALQTEAERAIEQRGVFHLALSGGSSPLPFYQRLVTDPDLRAFPWSKTHIWLVDDRRVPESDERSNMAMLRESLIDHIDLPADQVHPMPVLENDPATPYEQALSQHLGDSSQPPALDFILLGMGGDCHTASLFPGSAATGVTDRWIVVNDDQAVTPPPRVTMTFPLINAGRYVAVLLTGSKKAQPLQQLEKQLETVGRDPQDWPISGIDPAAGPLHWYLDAPATGVVADNA
jgi:6-phosphogluconolactonase